MQDWRQEEDLVFVEGLVEGVKAAEAIEKNGNKLVRGA
jgi:hypothetical protein